jgi:hypothetical protein
MKLIVWEWPVRNLKLQETELPDISMIMKIFKENIFLESIKKTKFIYIINNQMKTLIFKNYKLNFKVYLVLLKNENMY